MIEPDLPELLALACEVAGGRTEEALAAIRPGEAASVLARAMSVPRPTGLAEEPSTAAAALLHEVLASGLAPGRGERLAVLAALHVLGGNGLEADLGPPDAVRRRLADVRAGAAGVGATAAWLTPRVRPALGDVDVLRRRLSVSGRLAITAAQQEAGRAEVGVEQLFLGVAAADRRTARAAGPALARLRPAPPSRPPPDGAPPAITAGARSALAWAGVQAVQQGRQAIDARDVLAGLLRDTAFVGTVLLPAGIDLPSLRDIASGAAVACGTLLDRLRTTPPASGDRALDELRRRVHHRLIEAFGPVLATGALDEPNLRLRLEGEVRALVDAEAPSRGAVDRAQVVRDVVDDALGYGPVSPYLADPDVSEVMVNGPGDVYVERFGKIEQVDARFLDEAHLRRLIDKIVGQIGRRIDEASPMVDARLPDGSRVNAVVHPLAVGGPFLTIRKFRPGGLTVEELVDGGTLDERSARFLERCVRKRLNIVLSGGTGTGKTTLLSALSSFIPADERVVVIEDAKELRLPGRHVLHLESRPPNIEGRGEVTIRDLVRNALRMRPDRIVVGECRSGEALDMLQAMNTGHDGSLTTVHANSASQALARIETMVLTAGVGLPVRVVREQMASAFRLLVHLTRFRDGTRRVTAITEVVGMEHDAVVLQVLFDFDWAAGAGADGRHLGTLRPTGIPPTR